MPYVIHYYTNTYPSSIKHFGTNIFRYITSNVPIWAKDYLKVSIIFTQYCIEACVVINKQYQRKQRNNLNRGSFFVKKSLSSLIHLWVYIMILHVIKNIIYWAPYFQLLQIDGLPIMTPSLPFFHHLRIVIYDDVGHY